jgi:acyl carrier protein
LSGLGAADRTLDCGVLATPTARLEGTNMTRIDIASAVEEIVAAVAEEHGLFGARDLITPESTLNDQLGMDEADIVEVILRAENRFGISLPDNGIGFSSTLTDVVDLIAQRLSDKQASLTRPHAVGVLPRLESPLISDAQAESDVLFVPD